MSRRILSKISLTLSLVAIVGAQSALAIDTDTKEKLRLKVVNTQKFAIPSDGRVMDRGLNGADRTAGQYVGALSGASNLGCTPGATDPVRGLTFGCTFYDYQRNGSTNRLIGTNEPGHYLNFTWMNQDNNSATGGRNVKYEGYDPTIGTLSDGTGGVDIGGDLIAPNRSGYTALDTRGASGLAVNTHHWDPQFGAGGTFNTWVFYNQTPSLADFAGTIIDTAEANTHLFGDATQILWPRVAYTNDGAGTEVTHLLIHSDRTDADGDDYYVRKVGSGVAGTWSPSLFIGAGGYNLSPSMTASRKAGSQKVVICASFGRGDGSALGGWMPHQNGLTSGQIDNDLFYMESTDAGASWGPLTNVTQRPDSLPHPGHPTDQFAVGAKLDVTYDQSDVFHVVWQAPVWNGYQGPFPFQGRLFHYDPISDNIRVVHDFVWDQVNCNGGVFNLNATNPQVSECDTKLYVTFEQFNDIPNGIDDDCSENAATAPTGSSNADIYVTVSDNGGQNWDIKRNLTDTYTPDCDTLPGGIKPDCDSDAWHSTTRYGIDIDANLDDFDAVADLSSNIGGYAGADYLFVSYVNDSDPGGGIRPEGSWTNSGLKVFRFGCVEKVSNPVIASSIPIGQAVEDPAHTLPGTDSVLTWVLTNVGNAPATYTVTISNQSPPGNLTVTGGALSGTILESTPNTVAFDMTLNAALETTVQHAHADIEVSGAFFNSPMNFAIDYTIADLQLRVLDTVGQMLVVANNGVTSAQANGNGGGNMTMDFQNSPLSLECDTTANAQTYLFDGSPIVSYPGDGANLVVSSMFDVGIVDSFLFRPLTSPSNDDGGNVDWYLGNSGNFTTQDSTLCFTVDYFSPKVSVLPDPDNWKVMFGRLCVYNTTASPIDSVFCAYGWDWDVPSDSGSRNTSTIDAGNFIVSMQGAEWGLDTGNTACQPNDERWAATMYIPTDINALTPHSDGGSGAMGVGFQSLYTRDNASYVTAGWDYAKLDTALHTIGGFAKFTSPAPDSQEVDLHMVLNGGAYRVDPDDTLYMWFVMITGIGTQGEYDACITAIKGLEPPVTPAFTLGCCEAAGDYNNDGSFNIADVTAGIARIFGGGPVYSCQDQADANGDGSFNIADVTYGIARIFGGGPAPICGTTGT